MMRLLHAAATAATTTVPRTSHHLNSNFGRSDTGGGPLLLLMLHAVVRITAVGVTDSVKLQSNYTHILYFSALAHVYSHITPSRGAWRNRAQCNCVYCTSSFHSSMLKQQQQSNLSSFVVNCCGGSSIKMTFPIWKQNTTFLVYSFHFIIPASTAAPRIRIRSSSYSFVLVTSTAISHLFQQQQRSSLSWLSFSCFVTCTAAAAAAVSYNDTILAKQCSTQRVIRLCGRRQGFYCFSRLVVMIIGYPAAAAAAVRLKLSPPLCHHRQQTVNQKSCPQSLTCIKQLMMIDSVACVVTNPVILRPSVDEWTLNSPLAQQCLKRRQQQRQ